MPNYDPQTQMQRLLDKNLSPDELAALPEFSDEQASEALRDRAIDPVALAQSLYARDKGPFIEYEALEAYVEGRAGDIDREVIESMLELDPVLADMIASMREVRAEAEMGGLTRVTPEPAMGLAQRLRQLLARPAYRYTLELGLAAGVAFVVMQSLTPAGAPSSASSVQELQSVRARVAALQDEVTRMRASSVDKNQLNEAERQLQLTKAELQSEREKLDRTLVAQRDRAITRLNDGRGEVSIINGHAVRELSEDARRALVAGSLAIDDSLAKPGMRIQSMGSEEGGLVYPVLTAVPDARPTLRWKPLPSADAYQVFVVDGEKPLAVGETQGESKLRVPAGRLQPGKTYRWFVLADKAGEKQAIDSRKSVGGWFRVLSTAEARELAVQTKRAEGSSLALGVAYAKYGLLDEAQAQLDRFAKLNPKSEIPRRLLAELAKKREQMRRRASE